MDSAGVTMRGRPTPNILEFLETTFIPEKQLAEDNRRHMEGYTKLFAKILGDKLTCSPGCIHSDGESSALMADG